MYSDVKSVQILIALMKEYGIKNAVLSSGTCSIPVLYSLESDDYFTCYSNIDERSAVYFAMGIAQMKQETVAVVCTSGTAACNYLPGICEAMRLRSPILVITCDKDPYTLGHLTIQKINQEDMYANNCKYSVNLPVIKDKTDEWVVQTQIIKAIFNLNHHGTGPVHINIYTDGDKKTFNTRELPTVNKIQRYNLLELRQIREELIKKLQTKKRILLIAGQSTDLSGDQAESIVRFARKFGAVISAEYVANFQSEYAFNTYALTDQISYSDFEPMLKPDLIISFGGNYTSYELKTLLKRANVEHWYIDPSGDVVDVWRSIKMIFECSVDNFFEIFETCPETDVNNQYRIDWKNRLEQLDIPTQKFTSLYVVKEMSRHLTKCSLLHAGILSSSRLINLINVPRKTRIYSNLGALGIDGSLSTFLGQATANREGLSVCLIGDLSFFYDINSMVNMTFPDNVRIILLNNGGGSEFHLNTGLKVIPTLDNYISAGHTSKAEDWAKSCGLNYFKANKMSGFSEILDEFMNSQGASFLEVETDIEEDAQAIKDMYIANHYDIDGYVRAGKLRKILVHTIGMQKTQKIIKMAKIWFE